MKRVFTTRQCVHVWAQQSQDEGRGGNVYFSGPTIYSYGEHFPMGHFVEHGNKRAVIVTSRTYDNTASGHVSAVKRAIRHIPERFTLPLTSELVWSTKSGAIDHDAIRRHYEEEVALSLGKAGKARKYASQHWRAARGTIAEANRWAKFWGRRWRIPVPDNMENAAAEAAIRERKYREKQERKAREQRKRQRLLDAETYQQWRDAHYLAYGG